MDGTNIGPIGSPPPIPIPGVSKSLLPGIRKNTLLMIPMILMKKASKNNMDESLKNQNKS